jgi:ferredoxin
MAIEIQCRCGAPVPAESESAAERTTCPACRQESVAPSALPNLPQPAPAAPIPAAHPVPAIPAPGTVRTPCSPALAAAFASRHQALTEAQVVPDAARCVQCGICSYNCPMGIDVRAHAWRGKAIFDSHCLTCSECVSRCPRGVLRFERLPLFAAQG